MVDQNRLQPNRSQLRSFSKAKPAGDPTLCLFGLPYNGLIKSVDLLICLLAHLLCLTDCIGLQMREVGVCLGHLRSNLSIGLVQFGLGGVDLCPSAFDACELEL